MIRVFIKGIFSHLKGFIKQAYFYFQSTVRSAVYPSLSFVEIFRIEQQIAQQNQFVWNQVFYPL